MSELIYKEKHILCLIPDKLETSIWECRQKTMTDGLVRCLVGSYSYSLPIERAHRATKMITWIVYVKYIQDDGFHNQQAQPERTPKWQFKHASS